MEAGKSDQDYDEFDKILGEIPHAATGHGYTREPIQSSASSGIESICSYKVKKSSTSSNLYAMFNAHQAVKGGVGISADDNFNLSKTPFDQEDNSSNYCQALPVSVDRDVSNLPDDQSLASAFKDMSFEDKISANSMNPFFKHNQSSPSHPYSLDGHCSANFSRVESTEIPILPPLTMLSGFHLPNLASEEDSPFITKDEPNIHGRIEDGHNHTRFPNPNFHDPRNQVLKGILGDHRDLWQSFPVCSAAVPVNPGTHTFVLPGFSAQGIEFPDSSFQQQYYMDAPSHACITHQQLSQFNTEWYEMKDVRNDRSYPQCLYLKQLENQHLEGHLQRRNSATGPLSGNALSPYFHMPLPPVAGQVNLNFYENDNMANRRYNQLDPSILSSNLGRYNLNGFPSQHESCLFPHEQKLSSCGLYCPGIGSHGYQVLDRYGKQAFPEKIPMRSNGVNSLQTFKSGSIGSSQFLEHVENTRRVIPNNNLHSRLCQCVGSSGIQRSQGSSPDNSDENHDLNSLHLKSDSLNNYIGQIHMLAKDQNGCRFLQRIFNEGNRDKVDKIFLEIIDHVIELMTDPFGNYLVQKLVEVCTVEQITHVIHEISQCAGELLRISCNQHGTRVVQKIVETMKTEEQYNLIVSSLKPDMVSLIKNSNGSHVAQRCLQYLSPDYRKFLFEAAVANCIELARDRQGCVVVQKCLSDLNGELKLQLITKLTSNACDLSQDPYGNYVVQYLLEQGGSWATNILDELEGHYRTLSVQKFSSNVVEKCLKYAGNDRCLTIVRELINDPYFVLIAQDRYGNYVIQAALRDCKGAAQDALKEAIRRHEPVLRVNPFGKRVLSGTCYGR